VGFDYVLDVQCLVIGFLYVLIDVALRIDNRGVTFRTNLI